MTEETRKQKIKAVQAILDMLTQNPELPLPFHMDHGDLPWAVYTNTREQFELFLRLAPQAEILQSSKYLTATVGMGGLILEARLGLEAVRLPDEWVTKKTVEETEIDFEKVRVAALGT